METKTLPDKMDIQVFNNFNQKLEFLWKEFEISSSSFIFHSYDWQKYWYQHVGQPKYNMVVSIIVFSFKNKVKAIFPFVVKKTLGARVLQFIGGDQADYSAPLMAKDMSQLDLTTISREIWKVIPTHDIIYYRNVPEFVEKRFSFLTKGIKSKKIEKAYSAILPNGLDEYFLTLSNRMLKDNRRMLKKLNQLGELKFIICHKKNDFDKILKILIQQKAARSSQTEQLNIFNDSCVRSFYSNFYFLYEKGLDVHLSAFLLDDQVLATHLGFVRKKCFYYIMPTFNQDEKWAKFSLGRLHLEKLITWAINNGIKEFDFTTGSEQYKKIWCNNERLLHSYIKMKSINGIFYYCWHKALNFVKSTATLRKVAFLILKLKTTSKKT